MYLILDSGFVILTAFLALFAAFGLVGKTAFGRWLWIIIPCFICVVDIYLLVVHGNGLKERAICFFKEDAAVCNVTRSIGKPPDDGLGGRSNLSQQSQPRYVWKKGSFFETRGLYLFNNGQEKLIKEFDNRPTKIAYYDQRQRIAISQPNKIDIYNLGNGSNQRVKFYNIMFNIYFNALYWSDGKLVFNVEADTHGYTINDRYHVVNELISDYALSGGLKKVTLKSLSDPLSISFDSSGNIVEIRPYLELR
jgi:hypothetical protein